MGHRRILQRISLAAIASVSVTALGQVSGTWVNCYGGTWGVPSNWGSNPLTPGNGGTATFVSLDWYTTTIVLRDPVSLSAIHIDSPWYHYLRAQGPITLVGPAVVDVGGFPQLLASPDSRGHTIDLPITGVNGLTKQGSGRLILRGANTYTGGTTLKAGTVAFSTPEALGSSSGALTFDGGALALTGTLEHPIRVTSAGGTISLGGGELSGPISGDGTLTIRGEYEPYWNYPFTGSYVTLSASSPFSGSLVNRGIMYFADDGALTDVKSIFLTGGLHLSGSQTATFDDRVSDSAELHMRGGYIRAVNPSPVTEHLGTLIFENGYNAIYTDPNTTFVFAQIVRPTGSHAIADFGDGKFHTHVRIAGTPPPLSGSGAPGTPQVGILPWARYASTGFATVEDGVIRPLAAAEYISSVPKGITTSNVFLSTSQSLTSPATVNSLTIDQHGELSGSGTLSVTSGGVFFRANAYGISVPLNFGATEGIILGSGGISGPISGSGGLTIGGSVGLTGLSTYTGTTTVIGVLDIAHDVIPGQPGPLGIDISPLVLQSHGFQATLRLFVPVGKSSIHFNRDITVNNDAGWNAILDTMGSVGVGCIGGKIQLNGPVEIFARRMSIEGKISGPSTIFMGSGGTLELSGDNDFSGGVEINSGTLLAGSDTAFGTGVLRFDPSTYPLAFGASGGPRIIPNPVQFPCEDLQIIGSEPILFSGPTELGGLTTVKLNITNTATTRFAMTLAGRGIDKKGNGVLELANAHLQRLNVSEGLVRITPNGGPNGTSRIQILTILSNLDLTNNALIWDYTTDPAVAGNLRSMLADGRLFSSLEDSHHTLGYVENTTFALTSFGGLPVDASCVLIGYTWFGDSNLDKKVDLTDLTALASHWNSPGIWVDGDFNYDSFVDITDLCLLAANWQAGVDKPQGLTLREALALLSLPDVTVPEPNTTGVLSGALTCLLRRRRT